MSIEVLWDSKQKSTETTMKFCVRLLLKAARLPNICFQRPIFLKFEKIWFFVHLSGASVPISNRLFASKIFMSRSCFWETFYRSSQPELFSRRRARHVQKINYLCSTLVFRKHGNHAGKALGTQRSGLIFEQQSRLFSAGYSELGPDFLKEQGWSCLWRDVFGSLAFDDESLGRFEKIIYRNLFLRYKGAIYGVFVC